MTAEQIEEMVRVIAGSFPTSGVYPFDVIKAWQRHDLISKMTVNEGRAVQKTIVNKHSEFPTVNAVVATYYQLFRQSKNECLACQSSGWIEPPRNVDGERPTKSFDEIPFAGLGYTYCTKCPHCA